ncbi:hypothetical protein SAPIO_CDS0968 [Scedosporium apiospermum]|uniref:Biogenesis of lysosome-related organelles complex 1 subunit KXD1 n=1 Tax=Pseudallescheria apiosperma TaxID=563466 RepID=A0A084GFK0_PSEDA|nr:uncharacterized protein SAPIO_CDS0968 [Scedosporium apiospermum]KEZ46112.1 hypothetical protein SAPIO_CDS0968 [Scedosporium apiospermum]
MSTHYTPAYSLPVRVPTKGGQYSGYSSAYSVSPPEVDDDLSSTSGVASYSNSGYDSSSYAGSGDYDSAHSASGIDFNEYMQDRFASTFNPIPLDKSMVTQAQTSGHLNAKHRELLELQKKAQARLAKTRERFQDGLRDAREVREDLEWTEKKIKTLKTKAARKHPKEFSKARTRYPSPE